MRTVPVVAALLLLTASPLIAQELPRFEWRAFHFREAGLTYSGKPPLQDTLSTAPASSPLGRRIRRGFLWAVPGLLIGGIAGALVDCDRLSCPSSNTLCRERNCTVIGALIGAGAGFVAGAIFAKGGRQQRSSTTVVPLQDGRLGIGASVRF